MLLFAFFNTWFDFSKIDCFPDMIENFDSLFSFGVVWLLICLFFSSSDALWRLSCSKVFCCSSFGIVFFSGLALNVVGFVIILCSNPISYGGLLGKYLGWLCLLFVLVVLLWLVHI